MSEGRGSRGLVRRCASGRRTSLAAVAVTEITMMLLCCRTTVTCVSGKDEECENHADGETMGGKERHTSEHAEAEK